MHHADAETLKTRLAEIDLDALRANFRTVKQRAGSLPLCAVVKADSYGHGAVQCARVFAQEALPGWLSAAWPRPCSCAGAARPCPSSFWATCSPHTLPPSSGTISPQPCYSLPQAQALSEAAQAAGGRVKVHLAVDTGMGRIGFALRTDLMPPLPSHCRLHPARPGNDRPVPALLGGR